MNENLWNPIRAPFPIEGVRAKWFKNSEGDYLVKVETLRSFGRVGTVSFEMRIAKVFVEEYDEPTAYLTQILGTELHKRVALEAME